MRFLPQIQNLLKRIRIFLFGKRKTRLRRIDPALVGLPPSAEVYITDLGEK